MLISCPKCHSIYEIPDDLIGKTGRNFRCQACANVWHAMRSDALGYEEEKESEPFIEPIPVSEPPARPWPSEKEEFTVPADTKSGKKTPSSFEILATEGDPAFVAPVMKTSGQTTSAQNMAAQNTMAAAAQDAPQTAPSAADEFPQPPKTMSSAEVLAAARQKREITLTSDYGTSFTISMDPPEEREAENTAAMPFAAQTAGGIYGSGRTEPRLTAVSEPEPLTATPDDHLAPPKPFKGYRKTCAFLGLLFLAACALFLRREAVAFYPAAELWYNKIGLTGLDNPQYLKFEQIFVAETSENGKPAVSVRAVIKNGSVYTTVVPRITVAGTAETFAANRTRLKGGETAEAVFELPAPPPGSPLSLNIGFAEP